MKLFLRSIAFILGLCGFCQIVSGANLTTTVTQAAGTDWTAAIWKTNGTGTAVSPTSGNTYAAVANGTTIGNGTSNTRIRNPAAAGVQTFPGDSLTLNTNTELRAKQVGAALNFPGVGGNPGLTLNGGMLNGGDDSTFPISGKVQVAAQSYISHGAAGGGGGVSTNRAFNFTGVLGGAGNMVILNAGTTVPQIVSGASNTFSGQWIVQCGWLQGTATNSLGTNSIMVNPGYSNYLADMPAAQSPSGPAWFEPVYDLNSAGVLTLTNGGVMKLHQNCIFNAVRIEGVLLSLGTHPYSELASNFPVNFGSGGSGSLTVQPFGPPPGFAPSFSLQPSPTTVNGGSPTQLVATVSGTPPFTYQWQKGTNGNFINAADIGDVSGSKTSILNFNAATATDAADYRLFVTNSVGAATSQVATVTVILSDTNLPVIAALIPTAGATVGSFTQIQVTFSKNVVGVDAADLLIDGTPANLITGSGSNYVFSFNQPPVGTVGLSWDPDSGITDLTGNYFDTSFAWTLTLADTTPPTLLSTTPFAGSVVSQLTQAQVVFSEPVRGVDATDLLVNGSPATNVTGSGAGPYVFQFPQPANGTIQFSWASNANITDRSPAANAFVGSAATWTATLNPATANAALTNIVINEFLAANVSSNGFKDEDGQLDDWIEIYNRGSTPINLGGWILTDTADLSDIWTFPATNIGAGQYVVIFASGENRTTSGSNLHTSFTLSKSGGYLGLYNADTPPRLAFDFAPSYPVQFNDISYGINSTNGLGYFLVQTPGGPNSINTLVSVVDPVHFSVPHGYFNQPFNLYLTTTTPNATVIYTTNGSQPSVNGGATNGFVFTGPISIRHSTVLRAAAFASGLLPASVTSESFFFVEDTVNQTNNPPGYPTGYSWTPTLGELASGTYADYQMDPAIVNDPQYSNDVRKGITSIPTISVMLAFDDFLGPTNGIYINAVVHHTKVPASMELIFPTGPSGVQVDCGLEMQGGASRMPERTPKHSFRVDFSSGFGPNDLSYNVFNDSPVNSFKTLVIDAGYNFWWNYGGGSNPTDQRYRAQCVRDQFTSDLMLALGHPSFHGQFYHLYLNGIYWGLHYLHERPDDDFAASYLGGDNSDYDVIKNTSDSLQVIAGDLTAWNATLALCNTGLTNNAQYEQLQQFVDVDNLIDYMIVNHWGDNDDWPQHNWYVIRPRTANGTFKFIIWDAEQVLKDVNENVTTVNAAASPAQIYNALRSNAEFRLRYADHLQKLFFNAGIFYTDPNPANAVWDPAHPERNIPASFYMKRINEVSNAIVDESARWGTYAYYPFAATNYTRNDQWQRELNNLLGYTNTPGNTANYFPNRSANVLNQYKAIGLFPNIAAPVFNQLGGNIVPGFALTMTNLNSGGRIYYMTNGTDPRAYGSGAVAPGAMAYTNGTPIVLNSSTVVMARVLNGGWSALTEGDFTAALLGIPIRITELMYNPVGGQAYEFLELQNIGATTVDMSGFSFFGIDFIFPNGTTLGPGGVMVLANSSNPTQFAARYPGVVVAGYYGGALNNSGERIALFDQNGNTITAVNYLPNGGWPTTANGLGNSLEVINPNGDPDDPTNWRASLSVNGSPGVVATVPATNSVRFNEMMAENVGAVTNGTTTNSDWLELFNPGTNAVDISNWSVSNSGNARKFVFPSGTAIPAGGYLVLWCDTQTNAPGLHSGFNLGRKGENLFLYDPNTNRVDAISFGLQLTNCTIGRVGPNGAWQLTRPTPNAANVAATVGPASSLVINEWLANSPAGGSDWIELYNASPTLPVSLTGLYLGTSNQLFEIRSLSFIQPLGYVQLFADELPGFDHLDFKLAAAGDAIVLYDYSGQVLSEVSFVNQLDSISEGRYPDGSTNIINFPGTSSPGASNYVSTYAGPVFNEFMARNTSAVFDSRTNTPDWLELYNPTPAIFNLAGMGLSVGQGGSSQWLFPVGTSIAANGYLIVWCDPSRPASTNFETELNFGSSLPGNGSTLYLFNTNGQTVDSIAFGFQVSNLSLGKSNGVWRLLATPTPGAPNSAPVALGNQATLSINEWLASPGATTNDWFELYNPDPLPVDLSGLYLTDDPSLAGMTNSHIAPLSFIADHGWVQFQADSHPSDGPDHVNFNLSKDGESIHLFATNLSQIDEVDFGLQSTGISEGRFPDGSLNLFFMPITTPGAANVIPNNPPVLNTISNRIVHLGQTIQFTAMATDPDSWYQMLVFNLTNSPAGTSINPATGAFSWTVTNVPAPGTNSVTAVVTDNGVPPLSATQTFQVIVEPPLQFISTLVDNNGNIRFTFNSVPGESYQLQYKNSLGDAQWTPLGLAVSGTGDVLNLSDIVTAQPQRFYRLVVSLQ